MNTRTGADIVGDAGEGTSVKLLRLCGVFILVNGVLLAPWWVLTGGLTALEPGADLAQEECS